ncbi:Hypothetical protein I5071_42410 [Sandaracinus amylolyticus]|nr:Hypothetical protein I5071_42410 [Sandaracinus amylolyticus]
MLLLSALAHPAALVAQSIEPYRPPPIELEPKRALTITGVSVFVTSWLPNAGFGLVLSFGGAESDLLGLMQIPVVGPIIGMAVLDWQDGWVIFQASVLLTQCAGLALWITGLALPGPEEQPVVIAPVASPELVGVAVRGSF